MGAQVKLTVYRSPWDHYDRCNLCEAPAGSPCRDLRRALPGMRAHLRVQPHPMRPLEPTYDGPMTWPGAWRA
jgi:hypothetical protein